MKYFSYFLFVFIVFTFPALAKNFLSGFEDIPVPSWAYQVKDSVISFSNEETHLIETEIVLTKRKKFIDIKNFYIDTLSQLGWNLAKNENENLSFSREDDILEITYSKKNPSKVTITLKN